MKNVQRNTFKLSPIAVAIAVAMASQLGADVAHAGSGFGTGVDPKNQPVVVPTFYANSPLGPVPALTNGAMQIKPVTGLPVMVNSGRAIRKFVDKLPGIPGISPATVGGASFGVNNLGQYIPLAVPEKWVDLNGVTTSDDYYEIAAVEFVERMHSDLPKATRLRGYVQLSTAKNPGKHIALTYPNGTPVVDVSGAQVYAFDNPHHLGPVIKSTRGTAVRVKFTNYLPLGAGGELFLPVDTTITGAGLGPDGIARYTQNRAAVHLVGGQAPWISGGSPHQWIAPAGEAAAQTAGLGKGASAQNVPDMADPGLGSMTLYFPNDMSARFMFIQDRASGLTRLNSYAGMEAGYLVTDAAEQLLVSSGVIPADQIPLIIEDKTFVPGNIAQQDAKWDTLHWGQPGDLWFPHVYETNQDPTLVDGGNPVGRWDYGPWFWPIFPAKYNLPTGSWGDASFTPEAFLDTPVINGTAYPTLTVDPKAYRFRILNASNDRFINLSLFKADSTVKAPQLDLNGNPIVDATGAQQFFTNTEVKMVPAVGDAAGNPPGWDSVNGVQLPVPQYPMLAKNINAESSGPSRAWPVDARAGGAPDPASAGPDFIVIGNDGGFLPAPVGIPAQPVTYEANRRSVTVGNIYGYGLLLGPAERSDAIVDFSAYAGQTLILYNDAPAPAPFIDVRNDYYTGGPDQTGMGGSYSTRPGYGPNTRTMMQIKVNAATPAAAYNAAALVAALPAAYKASQTPPVVPAVAYNAAFGTNDPDIYGHVATGSSAQPTLDFVTSVNGVVTLTGVKLITSGGPGTGSGTGYDPASPPLVVFNNVVNGKNCLSPGGISASAKALVDAATRQVTAITPTPANFTGVGPYTCAPIITFQPTSPIATIVAVTDGGSGYGANGTSPTVSIAAVDGNGSGATATATVGYAIASVLVTPGAGYTKPTVTVTGGGVTGGPVSGTATVGTSAATVSITNAGIGYTNPTVNVTGGGVPSGSVTGTATVGTSPATITLVGGTGYTSPTVTVTGGGVPAGSVTGSATVAGGVIQAITLSSTSGTAPAFTSAPSIAINDATGTGATATATVDPVAGTIIGVAIAPNAGFTSAPIIAIVEGSNSSASATASVDPAAGTITGVTLSPTAAVFTVPPTIAIADPTGTGAAAAAALAPTGKITGIVVTKTGAGYSSTPAITITDSTGSGASAVAVLSAPTGVGAQATVEASPMFKIPVLTKAEQELFDASGRYNSTGGVELPLTNQLVQTTVPLNYIDSATETLQDGDIQIWKIVDNGLWTNSIHFAFADVQLVNRVGWDGTVKAPSSNELGWKDTLRLNPLEDVIVAMRARRPSIPFGLPQSNRLLDPSKPAGTTNATGASGLGFTVAAGVTPPLAASNISANFDNEFVWNSAILGHAENDLTRPVIFQPTVIVPDKPGALTDALGNGTLTWTDPTPRGGTSPTGVATLANPQNEIGFKILKGSFDATGVAGNFGEVARVPANTTRWVDPAPAPNIPYQVVAFNAAGDSAASDSFSWQLPVAPTACTVAVPAIFNKSLTLNWPAAASTTQLQVWRAAGAGASTLIATLPATALSFVDNTVAALVTYTYQLKAVNGLGTTASPTCTVTTPMEFVAAPTALTATVNTAGTLATLRWTDNANNETEYWVETTTDGGTTFVLTKLTRTAAQRTSTLGAVTTTVATTPGKVYAFRITAVNVTGPATSTSAPVLSAPLNLGAAVPIAPATFSATATRLTWSAATGDLTNATVTYAIEQSTNGGTSWAPIAGSPFAANRSPLTFTSAAGANYQYRIQALATRYGLLPAAASGWKTPPTVLNMAPAASTTPVAAAGAAGSLQIAVTWTNSSTNITSFTIQRRLGAGTWTTITPVVTAAAATYSFTDKVPAAGSYTYRLSATSLGGTTALTSASNAVTAP